MPKRKFYAVAVGRVPGQIHDTWADCFSNVDRFKGCIHKSFASREEAVTFLQSHGFASAAISSSAQLPSASVAVPKAKAKTGTKRRRAATPQPAAAADGEDACGSAAHLREDYCAAQPLGGSTASVPVIDDSRTYRLEFDGASRRNPGPAGAGAVIYDDEGLQIGTLSRFLGQATNNEAEYTALILGLMAAHALGVRRLHVLGDSKLVVEQVSGRWRCEKPNLQPLKQQAVSLQAGFVSCTLEHVLRHLNSAADELSNIAIDTRGWDGIKLPDGSLMPLSERDTAKRARTLERGGIAGYLSNVQR